ncbi:hypothetical protein Tco_1533710 [Tanacetum coccineum]
MVRTRHNNDDGNGQPNLAALIAKQLQNIIPQIVTQVTANVNNANGGNGRNGGNGGNNGCSYKGIQACGPKEGREAVNGMSWNDFKALLVEEFCPSNEMEKYIAGLVPEIRGMVKATQPTTIQNTVLRAGLLTDEAISCGTLSKGSEKRKADDEGAKSRDS